MLVYGLKNMTAKQIENGKVQKDNIFLNFSVFIYMQ